MPALYKVASFIVDGRGFSTHLEFEQKKQTVHYILLAAEQGYAPAQYCLGQYYHRGERGLPRDIEKTAHYYILSAEQGYAPAQYCLGWCYEHEEGGLPRDIEKAAHYYILSAEQGNTYAKSAIKKFLKNIPF